MWLVSGSGFIMDVLHSIWPKTKFMIVQVRSKCWWCIVLLIYGANTAHLRAHQVGKKIYQDVLANKQYQLFVSLQEFGECVAEELRPTAYRYTASEDSPATPLPLIV